jgi:predicted transcriptional regulator
MDAGQALRYARRRARLTQRALAEKAGIPQPVIARIERGAVSPRINTIMPLLEAAGFTFEVSPIIGQGVDRSLVRASLERTPEERIRAATRAAENLGEFRESVRDQKR